MSLTPHHAKYFAHDLDFGLYRVVHARSADLSQFLDKELLPQVYAAFGQYKTADKVPGR
ncbi:MAG: hypothetical protein ABIV11_01775 [Gemmatimonadaceae bacterium]